MIKNCKDNFFKLQNCFSDLYNFFQTIFILNTVRQVTPTSRLPIIFFEKVTKITAQKTKIAFIFCLEF